MMKAGKMTAAAAAAALAMGAAAAPVADTDAFWRQDGELRKNVETAKVASLPNVLILGDSISLGYTPFVVTKLAGVANVDRPKCNCGPSVSYLRGSNLKMWVERKLTNHWDVIHVNFGIWDNHYIKGSNVSMDLYRGKEFGTEIATNLPPEKVGEAIRALGYRIRTPLDEYEKNMRQILAYLTNRADRVVFGLTTPMPHWKDDDRAARIGLYNDVAVRVCKEMGVAVDDLHAVAEKNLDKQLKDGCHFKPAGYDVLADAVVESVKAALKGKSAK